MEKFIVSDLVMENSYIERIPMYEGLSENYSENDYGCVKVCRACVSSGANEEIYGCKAGNYVTAFMGNISEYDNEDF